MDDPWAISEAINNSVNNYLWTEAVIRWIGGGIALTVILLLAALVIGGGYWCAQELRKSAKE